MILEAESHINYYDYINAFLFYPYKQEQYKRNNLGLRSPEMLQAQKVGHILTVNYLGKILYP